MQPTADAPRSSSRTLRHLLPVVIVVVVIAVIVAVVVGTGGGGSSSGARARAKITGGGGPAGGPVTFGAANAKKVDWGPTCDTSRGTVAVPFSYAPPCVAPFDAAKQPNGGATWSGVTGTTITVVLYQAQPDALQEGFLQRSGSDESLAAEAKTTQQYIDFFQAHYQTYGRTVKLVVLKASGSPDDDATAKADAIKIATQIHAFAVFNGPSETSAFADELAARGILCLGECMLAAPNSFVSRRAPYVWLTLPSTDQAAEHWTEFIRKELNGHKAQWAGDAEMRDRTRVFGLVRYDDTFAGLNTFGAQFVSQLRHNGVHLAVDAPYTLDLTQAQENAATTIAKLKTAKVTTVLFAGDPLTPTYLTAEATKQHYYPEWVVLGAAYTDSSVVGRTVDQTQWAHAFGVSNLPTPLGPQADEFANIIRWQLGVPPTAKTYEELVQAPLIFFTGVHLAGPKLTPTSFRDGLFRFPSSPQTTPTRLHISWGNHGIWPTTDWFGADDATLIWWNPKAHGPDEVGNVGDGLWEYANGGKRYLPGRWPSGEPDLFDAKSSVTSYATPPPGAAPPSYPSPAGSSGSETQPAPGT